MVTLNNTLKLKTMKKVLIGLFVAGAAFATSAFTDAKISLKWRTFSTVYVTGQGGSGSTAYWTYDANPQTCGVNLPTPCQLDARGSFLFPSTGTLRVLKSIVNDPTQVKITSTKN